MNTGNRKTIAAQPQASRQGTAPTLGASHPSLARQRPSLPSWRNGNPWWPCCAGYIHSSPSSWLRLGRTHRTDGIVNAAAFGPNGSRIFCKEDEPDPPPEPGTVVVDKL